MYICIYRQYQSKKECPKKRSATKPMFPARSTRANTKWANAGVRVCVCVFAYAYIHIYI